MRLRGGDFSRCGSKGDRNQQRLTGQSGLGALALELVLQPLIDDALVRGVHVDNDQSLRVFCQDVDALQLRQGAAQWPVCSWRFS